ncbi:MAG: tRNA uridine(34) 5-carboxymethylaminomethyl modification radical SAM/GNAT enzyme Elp3 [Coriobacteriia bacterium]|nr:tRNA uridine(34) 5-carboxymethylaminomethyl modification radical SAM/GNAT enzyme Elp3 [Coriobacteriia bacterium]MCL2749393.1 tRNA uridine(34) 5-carboxymethylaminomethyl modification radical SAM/GNAT enzyme Elp3 [Coriobacteriia bacterium]
MDEIVREILDWLRSSKRLDEERLAAIFRRHNKALERGRRQYSKKRLLPYYLKIKETDPELWVSWGIDEELERKLLKVLRVKPRRTASGVATITVITKPAQCSSNCLYCPNDLRMPKSYLSDEPACQRAERNYFDPYLQVSARLRTLIQMGHVTDKIELIVLGGTWSDYPEEYQLWFITELFRALNDAGDSMAIHARERRQLYKNHGISNKEEDLRGYVALKQDEINSGKLSYNQAAAELYGSTSKWGGVAPLQTASLEELFKQQDFNETAQHRVVGLAIETRPELVSAENLTTLRQLGCTKIQMGVQTLNPDIHKANDRATTVESIEQAFKLIRVFGFKIHAHFMVNLLGATPEEDKEDYRRFVSEQAFQPDEVKLYPCSLVEGARLSAHYADKSWQPYSEEELVDVLVADTLVTPPFTRISRMIRDFSAPDVIAGNKKTNLRQLVERKIEQSGEAIQEIRYREISTSEVKPELLVLEILEYETANTREFFLQWVDPDNRIAGFLRLSLPDQGYVKEHQEALPIAPDEAMIREVHVYGQVTELQMAGESAQHTGLGKKLVAKACEIAREQGYERMNVISSVGTREYYRNLGFKDNKLYQQATILEIG